MADSKAKGAEEAASEADVDAAAKSKAIADRDINNDLTTLKAEVGDHPKAIESVPANSNTSVQTEVSKVKSVRPGTDPELALGDLAHIQRSAPQGRPGSPGSNAAAAPTAAVKLRLIVSPAPGNSQAVVAKGGQTSPSSSSSSGGRASSPGQGQARPRPKSVTSSPPKSGNYIFGSCFGSPTASPSGKLPSPQVASPKQPSSPTRRSPPDLQSKPHGTVVPSSGTPAEKKAVAPDSAQVHVTANKPGATPVVEVVAPAAPAPVAATVAPSGDAPAISRSPSCRCSVATVEAEIIAGAIDQSTQGITAGSAPGSSMSNTGEPTSTSDPGISSGQQVLNAQTEELIAAVKRADEEARQAAAGVSPIRGLRPSGNTSSEQLRVGRRRRIDSPDGGGGDHQAGARERRQLLEGRSRSPHNCNYRTGGGTGHGHYGTSRSPSPEQRGPSAGVDRLFDSIIGRGGDHPRQEAHAASGSPSRPVHRQRSPPQTTNRSRDHASGRGGPGDMRENIDCYSSESSGRRDRKDYDLSNSGHTSSPDRTWEDLSDLPEISRDREFVELSTQPANGTVDGTHYNRDRESDKAGSSSSRDRGAALPGTFGDPRVLVDPDSKEPRSRGSIDPSFSPRPGDIIIRARKRAGLRLTDFYYYDNENYMEQGDQILRARFEYLRPNDRMYLWCRLYVYSADGTYIYLDSSCEDVSKT